jgi:myo-inositol 2-dehydrogenase/D-chiro-inositol 1-dehydrogenase
MSDDLRVAVLGVGMMGAFHVDALSRRVRGARVSVVNDFLADKAAEVAGSIGARAEADPIAAINDPDVDAVPLPAPGRPTRNSWPLAWTAAFPCSVKNR